jgi:hypothetical protein
MDPMKFVVVRATAAFILIRLLTCSEYTETPEGGQAKSADAEIIYSD